MDASVDGAWMNAIVRDGALDDAVKDAADGSPGVCCPPGVSGACGSLGGWSASGVCECYPDPNVCDGVVGKDEHGCDIWVYNRDYYPPFGCVDAGPGYSPDAGDGAVDATAHDAGADASTGDDGSTDGD
jgi:hypothetical protein